MQGTVDKLNNNCISDANPSDLTATTMLTTLVFFTRWFLINWLTWQVKSFVEKSRKSSELKLEFEKTKLRNGVVGQMECVEKALWSGSGSMDVRGVHGQELGAALVWDKAANTDTAGEGNDNIGPQSGAVLEQDVAVSSEGSGHAVM